MSDFIAVVALIVAILSIPTDRLEWVSAWWRIWRKRLLFGALGVLVFLILRGVYSAKSYVPMSTEAPPPAAEAPPPENVEAPEPSHP
jgi:hypothetical protein